LNEFKIVLVTELLRKLRSRIFWIATVGGVLVIAILVEAPFFLASAVHASSSDVILAGNAGLRAEAASLLQLKKDYRIVKSVEALPARVTPEYLDRNGHAGAALLVSVHAGRLRIDVYPRDLSAFDEEQFRNLTPLAVSITTGIPPGRIAKDAAIDRVVHPLDAKFKNTGAAALAKGVAFGLIFMLYLAIILGSQSVMSAVAEEKTSRIAEILIATIEPTALLYGKTIAAAFVAFVQVGLWIATAAILLPHALRSLGASATGSTGNVSPLSALDPWILLAFLAFFVLGYLQYASIYAAAASLVSRTEDLGIVTTPVIMPVVVAFFIAQYALVQPNAPIVTVCSFVPFLSPFVAFTRIAVTNVPSSQTAVALLVNVATVAACYIVAGKVYRVGMLLYGRPPSLRQIVAAMRA
jgi:ABC-2 type transport system permease protein